MISVVLRVLLVEVVFAENDILVKVSPEKIIDTFKSMMSSTYLRELADDFATKAAKHLLEQIKKNNNRILIPNKSSHGEDAVPDPTGAPTPKDPMPFGSRVADPAVSQAPKPAQKSHSDLKKPSPQVLTMLQDPSSDGDNLDRTVVLSDYEDLTNVKPVKTEYKINGKYFRNLIFLE